MTGIENAKRIKLKDIYDNMGGEENVTKSANYGNEYLYFYNSTQDKVYVKGRSAGSQTWPGGTGYNTTKNTMTFFIEKDNVLKSINSSEENADNTAIIEYSSVSYNFEGDYLDLWYALGNMGSGDFWINDIVKEAGNCPARWGIERKSSRGPSFFQLFDSNGTYGYAPTCGVRAVIYI